MSYRRLPFALCAVLGLLFTMCLHSAGWNMSQGVALFMLYLQAIVTFNAWFSWVALAGFIWVIRYAR